MPGPDKLSHWPSDEIAETIQMLVSKWFFWNKNIHWHATWVVWHQWTTYVVMVGEIHLVKQCLNSIPPGQNGRHFVDVFRCIFVNQKCCVFDWNFTELFPKGPIENNAGLVSIMAWRRKGYKPLSEPMLAWFTDVYIYKGRWATFPPG